MAYIVMADVAVFAVPAASAVGLPCRTSSGSVPRRACCGSLGACRRQHADGACADVEGQDISDGLPSASAVVPRLSPSACAERMRPAQSLLAGRKKNKKRMMARSVPSRWTLLAPTAHCAQAECGSAFFRQHATRPSRAGTDPRGGSRYYASVFAFGLLPGPRPFCPQYSWEKRIRARPY